MWIDLARIRNEADLAVAVADKLIPERSVNDAVQCLWLLKKYLESRPTLVVLDDTANSGAARFAVNWARDSVRSPSSAVYIPFTDEDSPQRVRLRELDPAASIKLFCDLVGFRDPGPSKAKQIGDICAELRHHPRLIELYAAKCRSAVPLPDLLTTAQKSHSQDADEIWKEQLKPLFDGLTPAHHDAFLRLCLLPAPLSSDMIEPLSGIAPIELGPAVKSRFLWELHEGTRYEIDVYIRDFARTRWPPDGQALADAEAEVRRRFAGLAADHAAEIDAGRQGDREKGESALDWFESQWPNLLNVYDAEKGCKSCNTETLFRIADSLVLFMIHRGHLDECERIFRDAVRRRRDQNDQKGLARGLNDLAVCLQFKGDPKAEEEIKECIEIRRNIPSEQFAIAQSFNTAAAICFEQASPGCALPIEEKRQALEKALVYAGEAQKLCNAVLNDANVNEETRQKFRVRAQPDPKQYRCLPQQAGGYPNRSTTAAGRLRESRRGF